MREKRRGGKRRGKIGYSREGRDDTQKREDGERVARTGEREVWREK